MTGEPLRDLLRTAAMQARLAACLYSSDAPGTLRRFAAQHHGHSVYMEHGHTAAAALVFRDHIHVTVCGTNDIRDWFSQNLDAEHMDLCGYRAHSGFATAAAMIYGAMSRQGVLGLLPSRALILGGHSAGGAIAQLLALEPGIAPREIITFGAPRVFSADSAATYRAQYRVHRFVSPGDPVPALPLRAFRLLYRGATYAHTSAAMELSPDGRLLMDQEIGSLRKLARYAAGWWLWLHTMTGRVSNPLPTLLAKHNMERYASGIAAALRRADQCAA